MKVWDKMKTESKLYYSSTRRDTTQTGGGPSEVKTDPILEQVCNILGRGCTGIVNVTDSDWVEIETGDFPTLTNLEVKEPIPKKVCFDDVQNAEILQLLESPSTEEPAANVSYFSNYFCHYAQNKIFLYCISN